MTFSHLKIAKKNFSLKGQKKMISILERVRKLDNFAIYFKASTEGKTHDFEASMIYKELVCSKLHFQKKIDI